MEKNAGEWTGKVEIRKKFLALSVACMAPGFKGRMFKLCVERNPFFSGLYLKEEHEEKKKES